MSKTRPFAISERILGVVVGMIGMPFFAITTFSPVFIHPDMDNALGFLAAVPFMVIVSIGSLAALMVSVSTFMACAFGSVTVTEGEDKE